jgi:hypothetical protein
MPWIQLATRCVIGESVSPTVGAGKDLRLADAK